MVESQLNKFPLSIMISKYMREPQADNINENLLNQVLIDRIRTTLHPLCLSLSLKVKLQFLVPGSGLDCPASHEHTLPDEEERSEGLCGIILGR